MSEADTVANPPEEVKAADTAAATENQTVKEEATPAVTEAKTEAEEPAVKEETETAGKEEPETKAEAEESAVKAEDDKKDVKTESKDEKPAEVLKTKGKIDYDDLSKNRKFDPSIREVTDDPVAIRKQVEFYFGDWNFPQDKFMWESAEGAENKPIAIEKIHSFKRMRSFQPYSAVVAALRDSQSLVVEGEDSKETVKRKTPYKPMPTTKAKVEAATVYVKGFGDEEPDTQFDLESFFSEFGDVKGLKLRRTNENFFKGSVFVTFASDEEAKKFLALDPAPKWKDHTLKIMSKREYCDEKSDLIRQGKLEPNSQNIKRFYEGQDSSSRGRGGFRGNSDDWKNRRDHDQRNGFKDSRGRGGRGRGGRGRGDGRSGGRGGGRGRGGDRFRGGRDGDRGDRRERRDNGERAEPTTNDGAKAEGTNGKRSREDDGPTEAPAAKKVDVKES